MTPKQKTRIGRKLSLVLRHNPQAIGINLDRHGWVTVEELLQRMTDSGTRLDFDELVEIVETNDKQRYSFDDARRRIRANQGHSLKDVDVELATKTPPTQLYHGTATRFLDSIISSGLTKRNRQHVHLSEDADTAVSVGARHGKTVVLVVAAGKMHAAGFVFYRSVNGVWLTDRVPVAYLTVQP